MFDMRRREFITLLGGAAAAWPLAARAQQPERVRRIGVLLPAPRTIRKLRPASRRSCRGCSNWAGSTAATCGSIRAGPPPMPTDIRKHAAELVALAPDVILALPPPTVAPLLQATRTVPIVFPVIVDPVGAGFVESLARPGGNATGFTQFEYGMSGKWLELLKEIAPRVTRVAVLRDPAVSLRHRPVRRHPGRGAVVRGGGQPGQRARRRRDRARRHGIRALREWRPDRDGERGWRTSHRELIITLAARHKLPAVYFDRFFVAAGGLISYGSDQVDQYRRAAGYVDRILKGEKPADLPVQAPTKYELVINLKTAKALGLDVPPTLLARADEVIE